MTDYDNLIKPLQDILVKKGYIDDDRKIIEAHVYKYPALKDKILVRIPGAFSFLSNQDTYL